MTNNANSLKKIKNVLKDKTNASKEESTENLISSIIERKTVDTKEDSE